MLVIDARRESGSSTPSSCRRPGWRSPGRWSREAGRWSAPPSGLPSSVQDCSYCCEPSTTRATSRRRTMPVDGGRVWAPVVALPPKLAGPSAEFAPFVEEEVAADDCPSTRCAGAPPALTMMSANCSGSTSRPKVLMVNWNCWPLGTGSWPICPAATCRFCWAMADTTSAAVSSKRGQFVGIEPGPQAVVALAEIGDVGHARQPAQARRGCRSWRSCSRKMAS